jgi:patatin-like phospholipase/acyl hydrolase
MGTVTESKAAGAPAPSTKRFHVLCLDGGGAKGFYTLGVLKEVEGMLGCKLHERFDLIFGTSTGSIIAALLCLGHSVDDIHALYRQHVVKIMARWLPSRKSAALRALSAEVFGDKDFQSLKTGIGIVTTRWEFEKPMIFKTSVDQAYAGKGTFVPGFGCRIGDAVEASCSAYPFFKRKIVIAGTEGPVELVDGGYCANNPTLYAIADASESLGVPRQNISVVSIGVGEYPQPKPHLITIMRWARYMLTVRLLQKVLEINTKSMDQLRAILFRNVATIRINEAYTEPEMATDMFEHDVQKLNRLWQRGRESFRKFEADLAKALS